MRALFPRRIAQLTLVVAVLFALIAVDGSHAQSDWASEEKRRGPCVLLANQNVLFGVAQQQGESIVITQLDQSEIRLPRRAVACWAPTIDDLYRYRVDHRQGNGITVHLDDAQWCLQQELTEFAQQELQTASEVDPTHPRLKRLQQRLERQLQPPREVAPRVRSVELSRPSGAAHAASSRGVVTVSHQHPDFGKAVHSPGSIEWFTRSVQSTLINKCGRCHGQSSDRSWRMMVPVGGSRPSAQTTLVNLGLAMPFVDPVDPWQSEILTKATQPHGGQLPILDLRHRRAVDGLKQWLRFAAQDAQLAAQTNHDSQPAGEPAKFSDQLPVPYRAEEASESSARPSSIGPSFPAPTPLPNQSKSSGSNSNGPKRLPSVANPFDPEIFNRQFHR